MSFELSFTLPTSDKSYLSFLKYKLLNISSATSIDGASPGLRTLYISFKASDLFEFLSIFKVSKIYGPLLIGSILTIVKIFSSLLMILASCSSVISKPAPVMISPLLFFTSFPKYLPTNSSLFTDIEISFVIFN